jgi:Predicted ATPase
MKTLFEKNKTVGVFKGFTEGGLEFHADLVLPYQSNFNNIPMHGQYLMIQLETSMEAVLGRITSISSDGKLSSSTGEDFNLRSVMDNRQIPEDLREQYLKYRVNIRVLGGVKLENEKIIFIPSHRRIPHVGSPVTFPTDEVLKQIASGNEIGADIGYFALGEYVYAGASSGYKNGMEWMQILDPQILVRFPVENLVSRRSFVFARAGFGKSNLNKLLFSKLYQETPMVNKRKGKVPVGTIIFDRDGEYFWPDDKGRPGLCDDTKLKDKIVVFTSREAPSPFYSSFVASGIKLDVRRFRPSDIISIAISREKQDQQNVRKLKGLSNSNWENLVNLIHENKNDADLNSIKEILKLENQQDMEALAARANMTAILKSLHDPSSQFMDMLKTALSEGKLCIVDISQLRGEQALILSGIIIKQIFDHNQEQFTRADSKTIPTITVIEEAQSVLLPNEPAADPYIAWVKEGRKYDLGALMITQQPGSIPTDILSQGDNWFIFHLLSAVDLQNVKRANAHFSDDILSSLLNEPIPGQGIFWSSVSGKSYPIPLRVLSFEQEVTTFDPDYSRGMENIYAQQLKEKYAKLIQFGETEDMAFKEVTSPDVLQIIRSTLFEKTRADVDFINGIKYGILWGKIMEIMGRHLPEDLPDKNLVYNSVAPFLDDTFGKNEWHTKTNAKGNQVVYLNKG